MANGEPRTYASMVVHHSARNALPCYVRILLIKDAVGTDRMTHMVGKDQGCVCQNGFLVISLFHALARLALNQLGIYRGRTMQFTMSFKTK